MPRRFIFLLAGLGLFLGMVLLVALRRQAPVIPGDEVHVSLRGRGHDCMACHGAGGTRPRGPNHPFGEECGQCHFETGERGRR